MAARARNTVRVIGGQWRRRLIEFPDIPDLRPTPDRVRETLFNWLGQDLTGLACLDLFAGSGALGFEAASRGARQVVMVEKHPEAVRALQSAKDMLSASQVEVVKADAFAMLGAETRVFDVAFLDPPFRLDLLPQLLPKLGARLQAGARVYMEAGKVPELPAGFTLIRQLRAGQVHSVLLEWQQA